jgi:hypothetical protein
MMFRDDIIDTRCTACGSAAGVESIRLKEGVYRQCPDCERVFASPMPGNLLENGMCAPDRQQN